ncbi:hypothetical protein F5X99DRAFT_371587 [Biscogniauxia marginata]|nr:hypothetical protein F5X99DRAFT_371587 [Biscogniauxia marginata]
MPCSMTAIIITTSAVSVQSLLLMYVLCFAELGHLTAPGASSLEQLAGKFYITVVSGLRALVWPVTYCCYSLVVDERWRSKQASPDPRPLGFNGIQ